jgi:hypothetical protein
MKVHFFLYLIWLKLFVAKKIKNVFITAGDWNDPEISELKSKYSQQRYEMLLGKDRELLSFSIDLKWLWSKIVDLETWSDIFAKVIDKFNPNTLKNESDKEAKNINLKILSGIRKLSKYSALKIFKGTLDQAQAYCMLKSRFMVLYVEDASDWNLNLICRKTLADNSVGHIINDQFVLYCGNTKHQATLKFSKSLGAKTFPYFAIIHIPIPPKNEALLKDIPEVLGVLNLGKDLRSDKVVRFLSKALELVAKVLVDDKKNIEVNKSLVSKLNHLIEASEHTSSNSVSSSSSSSSSSWPSSSPLPSYGNSVSSTVFKSIKSSSDHNQQLVTSTTNASATAVSSSSSNRKENY